MVLPKSLIKVVVLSLVVSLSGCAGNLSTKDRNRVGAVHVLPPKEAPKPALYSDATGSAAVAAGAAFGLVGGLVGGSIAAVSHSKGVKRFSPVTAPIVPYLAGALQSRMEEGLRRSGKLPLASGPAMGGVVTFDRVVFGVSHAGRQRFTAVIAGEVQVLDPRGDEVWFSRINAESAADFTLQEAQANPRVFHAAIDDAAERFTQAALMEM